MAKRELKVHYVPAGQKVWSLCGFPVQTKLNSGRAALMTGDPDKVTCQCCRKGLAGMERKAAACDVINHPSHYTAHPSGIECIEITEHMGFCLCNAVKYIWRADLKGKSVEDLEKARWYIDREIQRRAAVELKMSAVATRPVKADISAGLLSDKMCRK